MVVPEKSQKSLDSPWKILFSWQLFLLQWLYSIKTSKKFALPAIRVLKVTLRYFWCYQLNYENHRKMVSRNT